MGYPCDNHLPESPSLQGLNLHLSGVQQQRARDLPRGVAAKPAAFAPAELAEGHAAPWEASNDVDVYGLRRINGMIMGLLLDI